MMSNAATAEDFAPVGPRFMTRVFFAFAALAVLSLAISVGGKWLGRYIATVWHTEDMTRHSISIGDRSITIPANMTRYGEQRRDGEAVRVELYVQWPEMTGYTPADSDAFN